MIPHSLAALFGLYAAIVVFFKVVTDMPKMKTHKGIKKRFKLTAKGKLRYKRPGTGHLMSSKNAKRRRRLGSPGALTGVYADNLKKFFGK
jgi:large subunit ribosomal protein L35